MQYNSGERDMIIMKHTFIAEYPEGKKEKITCTLIDYGIPNGDSSMARTVALPVSIAIRLVLEGMLITKTDLCLQDSENTVLPTNRQVHQAWSSDPHHQGTI